MEWSSQFGNEYGATLEGASMGRLKHLIDLSERMLLDELTDLDATVHDEIESGRIEIRRASPVADSTRVKRHEVREPNLDLIHGESDHCQGRPVIDQAECRFLAGARTRALKDDPLALAQAVSLGKLLDCRFDVARRHLPGIQRKRDAGSGNGGKPVLVHIECDHDASQGGRDLGGISADTTDSVDDDK